MGKPPTRMNLKDIMLSGISQALKDKYYMGFHLYEVCRVVKIIETGCRMGTVWVLQDERVLCVDRGNSWTNINVLNTTDLYT